MASYFSVICVLFCSLADSVPIFPIWDTVTLWHRHVAWPDSLWLLIFHSNAWIGGRLLSFFGSPLSATYSLWRELRSLSLCLCVKLKIDQLASKASGRYGSEDPKITWLCVLHFLWKLGEQAFSFFFFFFSLNYLSGKRLDAAARELYDYIA